MRCDVYATRDASTPATSRGEEDQRLAGAMSESPTASDGGRDAAAAKASRLFTDAKRAHAGGDHAGALRLVAEAKRLLPNQRQLDALETSIRDALEGRQAEPPTPEATSSGATGSAFTQRPDTRDAGATSARRPSQGVSREEAVELVRTGSWHSSCTQTSASPCACLPCGVRERETHAAVRATTLSVVSCLLGCLCCVLPHSPWR